MADEVGRRFEVACNESFEVNGTWVKPHVLLEGVVQTGETYETAYQRVYERAHMIWLKKLLEQANSVSRRKQMIEKDPVGGLSDWILEELGVPKG